MTPAKRRNFRPCGRPYKSGAKVHNAVAMLVAGRKSRRKIAREIGLAHSFIDILARELRGPMCNHNTIPHRCAPCSEAIAIAECQEIARQNVAAGISAKEAARNTALMADVERAVPRHLDEDIRADVTQDILVRLLSKSMKPSDLLDKKVIDGFVKRKFQERGDYTHLSLSSTGGEDDRTLGEKLGVY